MRKLIKQEWMISENISVVFENYLSDKGCTVTLKKDKQCILFTPEESKDLKNIFESTNFIFKQSL